MNLLSSFRVLGSSISTMALFLSGSDDTPRFPTTWPRKVSVSLLNSHLSLLSVPPADLILLRTACSLSSCSPCVLPYTKTSSMCTITRSRPASISVIRRWKCSGALLIPNCSLLNQNLPNGVINVVRSRQFSSRGICQNPQLESSLVNTVAPASLLRFSSTVGRG